MVNKIIYTKDQIEAVKDGYNFYYPYEAGLSSQPVVVNTAYSDGYGIYSWANNAAYFETLSEITGIKNRTEINHASAILEDLERNAPDKVVFKEANASPVDSTSPSQDVISRENIEKVEERQREIKSGVQESNRSVRKTIDRKQELQELQEKIKETNKKLYIKVESPDSELNLQGKDLQTQAIANPKKFIEDTSKVYQKDPTLNNLSPLEVKLKADQAALATYETIMGSSPLTQAAIIYNVAKSPEILNKIVPDGVLQAEVKKQAASFTNQKLSQYDLYRQFAKIDNSSTTLTLNDVSVQISDTPLPGYKEIDATLLINDQIIEPQILELENEINIPDPITRAQNVLNSKIEALSVNTQNSDVYNSDFTQSTLLQTRPISSSAGSINTFENTGYIPVDNHPKQKLSSKKFGSFTQPKQTENIMVDHKDSFFGSVAKSFKSSIGGMFKDLTTKIGIGLKGMESKQGLMVVGGIAVAAAGISTGGSALTFLGSTTSLVGVAINPTNILTGGAFTGIIAPILGFAGSLLSGIFTAIIIPIIWGVICVPLLIALFLFIINSGAYIVPQKPPDSAFVNGGGGFPLVCSDEKGPMSLPPNFSSPTGNRAWEIVFDLYQGFWCFWNRSPKGPPADFPKDTLVYPPGYPNLFDYSLFKSNPNPAESGVQNLFWCTYLVVKAYNETGNKIGTNLYTPDMYNDFKGRGKIIDAKDATPYNIKQGSVVFFHVTTGPNRLNHVGVVYRIDGAGIDMVQSNAPTKSFRLPFAPGQKGIVKLEPMQVMHFGLP